MTVKTRQRVWYVAGDVIACLLATLLFNLIRHWWIYAGSEISFAKWSNDIHVTLGYVAFPVIMVSVLALLGFYNFPSYKSRYEIFTNGALGSLVGTLIIYFAIAVNDNFSERTFHYGLIAVLFGVFFLTVVCARVIVRRILMIKAGRGDDTMNVVVVGPLSEADSYARRLENNNWRMGYRVVGLVSDEERAEVAETDYPVFAYGDLEAKIATYNIKAFVVLASRCHQNSSIELVKRMYAFGLTILLPIDFYNLVTSRPKLTNIIGEPLVDITTPALSPAASNFKRIGDIVISFLAMILLLPLGLVVAAIIKLDSPGPVFYRQERIGYHRRKFNIVKFRSMVVNAEPAGPVLCSNNDARVTKLGRVMRKYRLDELPQFWNIFRGDMSLVGPRPEREYFLDELAKIEPAVFTLHNVRPGLTSLGVVKCGYASDLHKMAERMYFDLLYVENISFSLDLRIIFHTINTVVTGKGI